MSSVTDGRTDNIVMSRSYCDHWSAKNCQTKAKIFFFSVGLLLLLLMENT